MLLWQGIHIETYERVPVGSALTRGCRSDFSNRSLYHGVRSAEEHEREKAMRDHMDLGCGYSGQFFISCKETTPGFCALSVDISSCKPPTYSQALTACYDVPATTTRGPAPALPNVPDWLGVEDINFTLAEMPSFFNITTQTTTPYPCCEVHVGAVCRPDQNFNYPAPTKEGRWQADRSYERKNGYFPVVPCDRQAKSVPRKCPRVKIKQISEKYLSWPSCLSACNMVDAQAKFMKACNRTAHPEMEEKEMKAHKDKIASMTRKAAELEAFVADQMATVKGSKEVIDCFGDMGGARYNNLKLPQSRSGFEKMPLHDQCRLHGCKPNQCLEIKRTCKVPFTMEAPEVMCNVHRPNGTFTCVEKVGIMSNNAMSFGFGIAWMVIGVCAGCAAIGTYSRQYYQNYQQNVYDHSRMDD